MVIAVLVAIGGALFLLCGICSLIERRQQGKMRRSGYSTSSTDSWHSFSDTSHLVDQPQESPHSWGWGDGIDWSCGDGDSSGCGGCDGGGDGGGGD